MSRYLGLRSEVVELLQVSRSASIEWEHLWMVVLIRTFYSGGTFWLGGERSVQDSHNAGLEENRWNIGELAGSDSHSTGYRQEEQASIALDPRLS